MSVQATVWVWHNAVTESSGQRLVLLALADAAGGDEDDPRICWPSIERISKMTAIGYSTVKLHLDRLEQMGAISKVERRRRKNGNLGTWVYTVNFTTADGSAVVSSGVSLPRADPSALVQSRPIGPHEPSIQEPLLQPRTAAPLLDSFGGDGTEKSEVREMAPSRQIVGLFMDEWHKVVMTRNDYAMIPRLPHKIAAYKWLNDQFFKPSTGDPRTVEQVSQLVLSFMQKVRYDEITPKQGYSAWQCFIANISKLDHVRDTIEDFSRVIVLG